MKANTWETAMQLAEKHANSGGLFIRLANSGDRVVGAFCGTPYAREVVWTGERYETYDASVHKDKRPSLRVMFNFYVPDEEQMKIIEGGVTWFKDVSRLKEKYGLENWTFEIQRFGNPGDNKTRYSILPETAIDEQLKEKIRLAPLHDLAAIGSGDTEDQKGSGDNEGGKGKEASGAKEADASGAGAVAAGTVVAPAVAAELVNRLRALPRSAVDTFLKKFAIERVRDLPATSLDMAQTLLAHFEEVHLQPAAEIDPFA